MGLLDKTEEKLPKAEKVHTKFDVVYEEVVRKKTVKLVDIAKKCHISVDEAEKWAKLLQNQGLLELGYPPLGEPVLTIPHDEESKKSVLSKKMKLILFAITSIIVVVFILIFIIRLA